MWGLMLKDFLTMKWYILSGFLFGAITLTLLRRMPYVSPFAFSAIWLVIWFIFARGLFAFDEHGRSEAIVNSLPFFRCEIVAGRHLTSLILLAYSFLITLAWFGITKALGGCFSYAIPWAFIIAAGLISSGIATAILFPILFKVEFVKARWITFAVVFIFILPLFSALPHSNSMQMPSWFEASLGIPNALALGASILVFAALMALSIFVSTRLYRTREF